MSNETNAVWSSKSAQAEIRVWADGGCIYRARPTEPAVEIATYESSDNYDAEGNECGPWPVVVNGKLDGTLRFEVRS